MLLDALRYIVSTARSRNTQKRMADMHQPRHRQPDRLFQQSRQHAKRRGIEFKFSKEEWLMWWYNHLGPDWPKLRGPKRGQYVMARNNDIGAYEATNVRCILASENHREKNDNGNQPRGDSHGKRKLSAEDVLAIRADMGRSWHPIRDLAEKYGVSRRIIHDIRARRRWRHI